jgi:hypothetical protein
MWYTNICFVPHREYDEFESWKITGNDRFIMRTLRSSASTQTLGEINGRCYNQWTELNWTELNWLNWTELNWTDWTGLDWTELNWLDWTELTELTELNWLNWTNWTELTELNWLNWTDWTELNWSPVLQCQYLSPGSNRLTASSTYKTLSTGPADLVWTWKYIEDKKKRNVKVRQLFRNIINRLYRGAGAAKVCWLMTGKLHAQGQH